MVSDESDGVLCIVCGALCIGGLPVVARIRRIAHAVEVLADAVGGALIRARRLGAVGSTASRTARAAPILAEARS